MGRLKWGLIGGGEGSQIGGTHRIAARPRRGVRPGRGGARRRSGPRPGFRGPPRRRRGPRLWRLARDARGESRPSTTASTSSPSPRPTPPLPDRQGLPRAGLRPLCEKPLTVTVEEAEDIVRYGAGARPHLRRQLRLLRLRARPPREGDGRARRPRGIRVVVAEFAYGHHADAADADNPRVRWRYDPKLAGVSSVVGDAGIHALTWRASSPARTSRRSRPTSPRPSPAASWRMTRWSLSACPSGAVGRLWASAVAVGRMHGLTLQVYGEKGGLRWEQERPNQLYYSPLGEPTRIIERGVAGPVARGRPRLAGRRRSRRGLLRRLRQYLRRPRRGAPRPPRGTAADPLALCYPTAVDGLRSVATVAAAARSAASRGAWEDAVPASLR